MTNCVYIFGNGFDLRMGMATSYPDFLKYYAKMEIPDNDVASVKQMFLSKVRKEEGEHWKDLEIALGLFTKEVSDVELFKDFYRDLNRSLKDYLTIVEQKSPLISDEDKIKFWEDLMYPEKYLHTLSRKSSFDRNTSKGEVNANIINFNYTKTLENLLIDKLDRMDDDYVYVDPSTSDLFKVRYIKHLHGVLNETDLLFGVNDTSQIENKDFREDEDFNDVMIKPKGNMELGTNIDKDCQSLIRFADVFYIYGTSLGPTDKCWWYHIGERFQKSNAVILYFSFSSQELKKGLLDREYISLERRERRRIMSAMNISGDERNYRDRIYVACNRDIFSTHPKREIN